MEMFLPLVILILDLTSFHISGFNFDIETPIVKKSNNSGSYFGYSVGQHQSEGRSWILVGAPLEIRDNKRTGCLWKCPFSVKEDDCEPVVIDDIVDQTIDVPLMRTSTTDQWLGVTVQTYRPNGRIIVCAHRYVSSVYNNTELRGMCYILSHNFKTEAALDPCSRLPPQNYTNNWNRFCQIGVSVSFASPNDVYIGSPGMNRWSGNVYESRLDGIPMTKHLFTGNWTMPKSRQQDSYLGTAIASGKFLEDEVCFAASAPKYEGVGQIFMQCRNSETFESHDYSWYGEQFNSGFGNEMIVANVDGDKTDDLIVAAPFYFDEENVGGSIYIYTRMSQYCSGNVDSKVNNCRLKRNLLKIRGRQESRFGFAMTSLGDIQNDGYDDIAVGAPYENTGVVYIYVGSRRGIVKTPSQIIRAKESFLPRFGYSLSGGVDLDNNNHTDLVVGAHESDTVYVFRSHKVLHMETFIRYKSKNNTHSKKIINRIDPEKKGCSGDEESTHVCFTFQACFKMDYANSPLELEYNIAERDVEKGQLSRIYFSNNKTQYTNTTIKEPFETSHCETATLYVRDNTRDLYTPIKLRLKYTLVQNNSDPASEDIPDRSKYSILDLLNSTLNFEIPFFLDCGSDDICQSQLRVTAGFKQCDKCSNTSVLSLGSNHWQILLGGREKLIMAINVENVGEPAHQTKIIIKYLPSLSYYNSISNGVKCNDRKRKLICYIRNVLRQNNSAQVEVRFDPKHLEDESHLNFTISVKTSKDMQEQIQLHASVKKFAELSIQGNTKTSPLISESRNKMISGVLLNFFHNYTVYNEGPWDVNVIQIKISWPFEIVDDTIFAQWNLDIVGEPKIQSVGKSFCMIPANQSTSEHFLNRNDSANPVVLLTKQDIEMVNMPNILNKNENSGNILTLNCLTETAKCVEIDCWIYNLPKKRNAKISIQARLWNSTFANFSDIDTITIVSRAEIMSPNITQENTNDDRAEVSMVFHSISMDEQAMKKEEPLWLFLLPVILGFLILVIISYALYKLGFFKRHRLDTTYIDFSQGIDE